jgi:hypothetical protein
MLGIALGGFMQGFERGQRIRENWDEQREKRRQRDALAGIETETKKAFGTAVQKGETQPGDYANFWRNYALPRRVNEYLAAGDPQTARAYQEWGKTEAAEEGGRLFASALSKAQTGDYSGAIDDAMKAANTKGYMAHGYKLKSRDELADKSGNVLGYRFTMAGPDGKEFTQDVPVGQIPTMIANIANPDVAFQTQLKTQAETAKEGREVETYEKKKQIDVKYGTTKGQLAAKDRAKMIQTERQRIREENAFADNPLTEEQIQQEAIRRVNADAAAGASGGAAAGEESDEEAPDDEEAEGEEATGGRDLYVNQQTGESMPASNPRTIARARAAQGGGDPIGAMLSGMGRPSEVSSEQTSGIAAPPTPTPRAQPLLAEASAAIQQGNDPRLIGQRLAQAGIPPAQWPEDIKAAVAKAQPGLY